MVLGKFNLDDFWVPVDGFLSIKQLFSVGQPGHQLRQGVLELAQCQESGFQLVLGKDRDGKGKLRLGRMESIPANSNLALLRAQGFSLPVCEQFSRPDSPRDVSALSVVPL